MKTDYLQYLNKKLRYKKPEEIIEWALSLSQKRITTTSFGVYSSILLNELTKQCKNIDVVWCDTGYNTKRTYEYALNQINKLNLNINIYKPLKSKGFSDASLAPPNINNSMHAKFTEVVKLEPFRRAIQEHQPDVWFTNIRTKQTKFRDAKDILSYSNDGILKVSPFYHWNDKDLDNYIKENGLQKNDDYFDVTKVLAHRECGLHLQ